MVVAFRRHTLLPLDNCLYALQPDDPALDSIITASLGETEWHLAPAARNERAER
jgi:hypothetical protein